MFQSISPTLKYFSENPSFGQHEKPVWSYPGHSFSPFQNNQGHLVSPQHGQQLAIARFQQPGFQVYNDLRLTLPFNQHQLPEVYNGSNQLYNPFGQQSPILQGPSFNPYPTHFPLSNRMGRKKALLIGVNYIGTPNELNGCINDVHNIRLFLTSLYGFTLNDILILTDDKVYDPRFMPTRKNITDGMKWLVQDARPNDSLFFHFSGHGSQKRDLEGDELDGYDETILPLDFEKSGQIVDDEMNAILVQNLPPGCRLTCVFDCCHSGTALDLPYQYTETGELKQVNYDKVVKSTLKHLDYHQYHPNSPHYRNVMELTSDILILTAQSDVYTQMTRGSFGDAIMFSGCKDSQTSADAKVSGFGYTGAMSHALITALNHNPNMTLIELLNALRVILKGKYQQVPQLSSSHPMDLNSTFFI